jgi:cysteine desulfurase/selenocysteine lyase
MIHGTESADSHANNKRNVEKIREQFPIFRHQDVRPLVYLDSASTTQKPQSVIDAIVHFYTNECSNIHRGVHYLSERATESYERSRSKLRSFIRASSDNEIVFVRGATEGINLVAQTYGRTHVGQKDEILISAMEHHSNIVPWQLLCEEKGASLKIVPMNASGEFIFEEFEKLIGPKTRLVAVTHVSNAIGTVNPIRNIIQLAHQLHVPVLIDGAQSISHLPLDVSSLDCDFYTFSGHKMYGPTGIGVLYGKEYILDSMPPYQGGGEMIRSVTFEKTEYHKLPHKFEAGTPNISGAIGMGAAVDFLQSVGMDSVFTHEQGLMAYGSEILQTMDDVRMIGTAKEKTSSLSFVIEGIHPHDIATVLDQDGVAIRAGHHCAQPVMDFFRVPATARVSFGLYNTREDIDALRFGLEKVKEVFK